MKDTPISAAELLNLLFDYLSQHFEESVPPVFVGLQGDAVILIQLGGEHLGVQVVPVRVGSAV